MIKSDVKTMLFWRRLFIYPPFRGPFKLLFHFGGSEYVAGRGTHFFLFFLFKTTSMHQCDGNGRQNQVEMDVPLPETKSLTTTGWNARPICMIFSEMHLLFILPTITARIMLSVCHRFKRNGLSVSI